MDIKEIPLSLQQTITLWSNSLAVSVLIWALILLVLLYLGRIPAHQVITATSRLVYQAMRLAARAVLRAESRLAQRNREVLLTMAEEHEQRLIEREFHRVQAVVTRDLSSYPSLHRKLSDQITHIDEDYRESADVPPTPPAWVEAIESIAKVPSKSDPTVGKILQSINVILAKAGKDTITEYRNVSKQRHLLLKRMVPYWRKLSTALQDLDQSVSGLHERSHVIDGHMDRYEEIRAKSDRMARILSSSSLTQFMISGLVLIIAALGGLINFQLIALPMSEMVGGASYIGPVKTSDVAALVIIMVEIAMGLFLMEPLRITRLFPVINALNDQTRQRMIWITFAILFTLASIEAALAYMRDMLAADRQALVQLLSNTELSGQAVFRWIPSVGQMVLGFVLPFALTFVAIPLESFIHSSRTVIGVVLLGVLRTIALVLRLIGNGFQHAGKILTQLYDLLILLPLAIERIIKSRNGNKSAQEA